MDRLQQRFDECLDALYASVSDPTRLTQALAAIRDFTGAASATLATLDEQGRATGITPVGLDLGLRKCWVEYYSHLDPRRARAVASAPGEWIVDDDLLHPKRSPSPEYVNDFVLPAGLRWSCGGKVYQGPGGSATLCVQRPQDAEPFTRHTVQRLQRLFPHVQRTMRLSMELGSRLQGLTTAALALDALESALFVVDRSGRTLYRTAQAERLLLEESVLRLDGGRLSPRPPAADAWRRLLALACGQCGRQAGTLVLPAARCSARLWLRVLPLPTDHRLPGLPADPLALVVADRGPRRYSVLDLVAWFGLTDAEAGLVQLLAQGHDAAGCAKLRGVRLSTVRSQIASVLAKTGSESQIQLMALLGSFTALR